MVHLWYRTSPPRAAQVIKAAQTLSAVQGDWEVNHLVGGSLERKRKLGSKHIFSPEKHPASRWKKMTGLRPTLCCIRGRM